MGFLAVAQDGDEPPALGKLRQQGRRRVFDRAVDDDDVEADIRLRPGVQRPGLNLDIAETELRQIGARRIGEPGVSLDRHHLVRESPAASAAV